MHTPSKLPEPVRGFTLIELAVVLFIIMLLLGGLLPTVNSQLEQQRRNETRATLNDIQQALYGFAIINGRLPCPTYVTDPAAAGYGEEAASCPGAATADGYLPWKTLGVPEFDAWGSKRTSSASPWTGYWRYRTDRNFSNSASLITLNSSQTTGFSASDVLVVLDSNSIALTTSTERPVAIIYSTGKNLSADGENGIYNSSYQSDVPTPAFDDILIWVSRPQLFNRMVSAGKLPN